MQFEWLTERCNVNAVYQLFSYIRQRCTPSTHMRTNQKSLSAVNTYNPHEKQNGTTTTTRTTTRATTTKTTTISNKKLSFGLYSFLCSHRSRNVLKINAQRTKLADYKNINCIAKALATHNIEIPIERNRFPSPAATSTDRSSTRRSSNLNKNHQHVQLVYR